MTRINAKLGMVNNIKAKLYVHCNKNMKGKYISWICPFTVDIKIK